jgi:hypothetical protein
MSENNKRKSQNINPIGAKKSDKHKEASYCGDLSSILSGNSMGARYKDQDAPGESSGNDTGDADSVSSSPQSVMKIHSALDRTIPIKIVEGKDRKRQRVAQSPVARKKGKASVSFHRDPVNGKIRKDIIASNLTQEDLDILWYSRSEIRQRFHECDTTLKDAKRHCDAYVKEIILLFQQCSKESNIPKLVSTHASILLNPPREDLRGLERQMHKMLSQYRTFHVKSILKVQKKLMTKSEAQPSMLRSTSISTSRVSRAWAIVLAHGDTLQVAKMIRQELGSSARLASSKSPKKTEQMTIFRVETNNKAI